MSFETEVEKILQREGGYVNNPSDRGGETNFGISKRANPDVDVASLTREAAVELYRERYWKAINADALPENIRSTAFDAAVNQGVGWVQSALRKSGGDPAAFDALRREHYETLAANDPSQRQFLQGWLNRLDGSGTGAAPRARLDRSEAWVTSAQDIRERGRAQAVREVRENFRRTRDPLGEAAVDYLAALRTAQGGDAQEIYDRLRGREAAAADAVSKGAAELEGGSGVSDEVLDRQRQEQEKVDLDQQQASLSDQFSYLWRESSVTGALVDYLEHSYVGDTTAENGLRYLDHMDEWEKGRTAEEIDALREIGAGPFNREMIDAELKEQDRRREASKVMRGAGTGKSIALTLGAGVADPAGWLAGFGVYKAASVAGYGARAAFLAGRPVQGFALAGAEGAAGNVIATGAIDSLGKQQSAADYVMASGFGFAFGVPFAALELRGLRPEIARAEWERLSQQMQDGAAERMAEFNTRAREELGPEASPDSVAARASDMEREQTLDALRYVLAEQPLEDQMLPRPVQDGPTPEPVIQPNPIRMQPMEVAPGVRAYEYDDPTGATGTIMTEVVDGGEQINFSDLPASLQGQGIGRNMYRAVIDPILDRGGSAFSDSDVSVAAARVYESLSRDYIVKKNPAAVLDDGQWRTADNSPVFTVSGRKSPPRQVARPPGSLLTTRAEVEAKAKEYGLDVTISDELERALGAEMYARAEATLARYPIDEARLRPLLSSVGWEATSTRLLLSKNPLMRSTGVLLMENPEGAAGRRTSAALAARVRERAYRGAFEPHYESLLNVWAGGQGYGKMRTLLDHRVKKEFDLAVTKELNSRWMESGATTDNRAILQMADYIDQGFTMMGREYQYVGALGAARIPVGRSGYYPRVARGDRIATLNLEERQMVTGVLSDEFQTTAGFDKEFADQLAVKYLERAVDRAKGGWMVTLDLRSGDTADVVQDSLQALNYSPDEINKIIGRFSRGGPRFTKSRIDLDMNNEHVLSDGRTFKLADIFEDDILSMYKNYARRTAGEVALAQYGIMGAPGMKELRKAAAAAPGEWAATPKELEAFDQFAAEMLGTPFGTRLGKWGDNLRSVVSSAYLGGMGWTQLAESTNGIHAVGTVGMLNSIADGPRLLREVRAIGRGENPENAILNSIEVFNGSIGGDPYRIIGLRDVGDRPEVYGADQLGWFSLAVRGAGHATRVLSMQRAIEAVQVRGMSEQIVRKAMRYIREGTDDAALADMGITPQLREALARNMDRMATWQGRELTGLDLMQMDDPVAARAFAAVVDRGASQIIQRTYAGEVGRWAHHDHLLLLTQFRTYPMVATQKQWRRVKFSQGTARAVGLVLGAASITTPIYMARVGLQSIGKEEGWLDERLSPMELGRAAARYTSILGLTSDVIDAAAPVLGIEAQAGRSGAAGSIPVVSYINDLGRAATQKDPEAIYRTLPGNRVPYLQTAMQELFFEE